MKRLLLTLTAALHISLAFSALPAPMTKEELADLHNQTRQWKSYRIDFCVVFDAAGSTSKSQNGGQKAAQKFEGRYEMSGASFHIATPEIELFSDGATKWEVNKTYREIAIDNLTDIDRKILADPAQFFDQMGTGIAIEILKIMPHAIPGVDFSFDPARYPDFEIIDFR